MIRNEDNPKNSVLPFLIHTLTEARGQVPFCQNLTANFFEKIESPCRREIPDVKNKRQFLDHYFKGICSLTSQYGIYRIEIKSPNDFHDRYLIQTDEVDIEFSKVLTQYIKSIQHQNSIRTNTIFTNDVFSLIYIRIGGTSKRFTNSNISTYNCTTRNTHIFKIFKCNPKRSNN